MLIKILLFFAGFIFGMFGTSILFLAKLSDVEDELVSLKEEKRRLSDAVRRKQNKIDELKRELKREQRNKNREIKDANKT